MDDPKDIELAEAALLELENVQPPPVDDRGLPEDIETGNPEDTE